MMLKELLEIATDKNNFTIVDDYLNYAENYLNFIFDGLQAVIVSKKKMKRITDSSNIRMTANLI